MTIRACAILATYNEADIIGESVRKLIAGGVDVFVIDNGSTDRSVEILAPLVGRGVVDIRTVRFHEDGREIYDWTAILRLKETLSRELGFDWYLHVDADEIRYAPWPHLSLREGLDRVDRSGYNLVNFKLFNFRLTEDLAASDDFERDMPEYSAGEYFNQYQVKAWKAHREIDIAGFGGHIARRPDARIFPVRFIHKHYPVRSLAHGRRKILQERKQRFSQAEKQRGWHVQYDQVADVQPQDVFWSRDKLARFDLQSECLALLDEGVDVACQLLSTVRPPELEAFIERSLVERFAPAPFTPEHVRQLLGVSRQLLEMAGKGAVPPVQSVPDDLDCMRHALQLLASRQWLTGDASIFQRLASISLQTP
jgi:hypothetical protein